MPTVAFGEGGPTLDAIVGDLRERFLTHPSRFRYWRQVMLTIVVSAFAEIRAHKLLAVRAVLIGGIALYTTGQFHGYLRYTLSALAIIHVLNTFIVLLCIMSLPLR